MSFQREGNLQHTNGCGASISIWAPSFQGTVGMMPMPVSVFPLGGGRPIPMVGEFPTHPFEGDSPVDKKDTKKDKPTIAKNESDCKGAAELVTDLEKLVATTKATCNDAFATLEQLTREYETHYRIFTNTAMKKDAVVEYEKAYVQKEAIDMLRYVERRKASDAIIKHRDACALLKAAREAQGMSESKATEAIELATAPAPAEGTCYMCGTKIPASTREQELERQLAEEKAAREQDKEKATHEAKELHDRHEKAFAVMCRWHDDETAKARHMVSEDAKAMRAGYECRIRELEYQHGVARAQAETRLTQVRELLEKTEAMNLRTATERNTLRVTNGDLLRKNERLKEENEAMRTASQLLIPQAGAPAEPPAPANAGVGTGGLDDDLVHVVPEGDGK